MRTLTPAERRALRAKAHHLHPFVIIGQQGLTPAVLHEIDVNLTAHELIKIRVFGDDRDARETLLSQICDAVDAAPVQHLGKTLTVWRPAPEPVAPIASPRKAAGAGAGKSARRPSRPVPPQSSADSPAPRDKPPRAKPKAAPSRRRKSVIVGATEPTYVGGPGARRRRATADGEPVAKRGAARGKAKYGPPAITDSGGAKRPPRAPAAGKRRTGPPSAQPRASAKYGASASSGDGGGKRPPRTGASSKRRSESTPSDGAGSAASTRRRRIPR